MREGTISPLAPHEKLKGWMSGCKEPCFRATKPSRQMHGGATGRARAMLGFTDSVKNRWFPG